jgi:hypothetical protein
VPELVEDFVNRKSDFLPLRPCVARERPFDFRRLIELPAAIRNAAIMIVVKIPENLIAVVVTKESFHGEGKKPGHERGRFRLDI